MPTKARYLTITFTVADDADKAADTAGALTRAPSELDVQTAVHVGVAELPGVAVLNTHCSGRDPWPPVPEETSVHVATLRAAGHGDAADHLEKVAALHAREAAEHLAARTKLIFSLPPHVCSPHATTEEHADAHVAEMRAAKDAAAEYYEHWLAFRGLHHIAAQSPKLIDAKTVIAAMRQADVKKEARIARNEAHEKLVAEHEAGMKGAQS